MTRWYLYLIQDLASRERKWKTRSVTRERGKNICRQLSSTSSRPSNKRKCNRACRQQMFARNTCSRPKWTRRLNSRYPCARCRGWKWRNGEGFLPAFCSLSRCVVRRGNERRKTLTILFPAHSTAACTLALAARRHQNPPRSRINSWWPSAGRVTTVTVSHVYVWKRVDARVRLTSGVVRKTIVLLGTTETCTETDRKLRRVCPATSSTFRLIYVDGIHTHTYERARTRRSFSKPSITYASIFRRAL